MEKARDWEFMKLVITGGCGFIGSNLVRHVVGEGHSVVNIDLLTYAGNRLSLQDLECHPEYELVVNDVCDREAVAAVFRRFQPDAVLHLAAESHVDRSIDAPGVFLHTNVNGTFSMLQEALAYWRSLDTEHAKRFRFIHVSTDEVFGTLGPEDPPFTEESRYDPHSPYSASKAASDHLARAWHDTYGFPVIVTNCSNNYGPYQFPEKLIPVVILKALSREPIPLYGTGDNVRDWLYVEDHVRALLAILNDGLPGRSYNIGASNEMSNKQLVHTLCELLDEIVPSVDGRSYSSLITFVADRPGHDKRYAMNASRIKTELGWMPCADAIAALRKTVIWYVENQAWWQNVLNGEYSLRRLGLDESLRTERNGS
ncbi:MAG: dTDP-glucose 4,6-dehydratase [Coriobacteriia bacterium]